ncbi:MAG: hypothetical protein AB7S93_01850 [Xanthobacteraceae bacterium]
MPELLGCATATTLERQSAKATDVVGFMGDEFTVVVLRKADRGRQGYGARCGAILAHFTSDPGLELCTNSRAPFKI